jgi:adenylate kinase
MPGAGKGTIADLLKERPDMTHISTGDLFRSLDQDGPLGQKITAIQAAGKLVDDETVNQMVEPKLVAGSDILLDGYPRSIPQAEWLLDAAAGKFDVVAILLEIDESIAAARRDKRLRETLERGETPRKDDADPDALPKRFAEYREKTEPMLDYLREKLGDNFYTVDGSQSIDAEYADVKSILNS